MSGAGTLSTPGREQTQECEHSEPSGGRVWPAAGWHSGVLLQRGNKPRFYQQSKKKKKKRKTALLITFDFLLILCCWWWTGASSVLKPRCLHTAVISSWLFALISFFSALGKHHVEKKTHLFLYSASHDFLKLTSATPIRLDSSILRGWLRRVLSRSLLWQSWVCLSSHLTSAGAGMSARLKMRLKIKNVDSKTGNTPQLFFFFFKPTGSRSFLH